MKEKWVLVTGASSGIGAAITEQLVSEGYAVGIYYRKSEEKAVKLAENLRAKGGIVTLVKGDVSSESDAINMFNEMDVHGTLYGLVNNAGITSPLGSIEGTTAKQLQEVFGINVFGSFYCAREAVKRMAHKHGGKGGVIINISSIASRIGSPHEYVDYAASKGAVDTLTLGLAKEVADEGIRVVGVKPGLIDTEIHALSGDTGRAERLRPNIPMQRVGKPEEVAAAVIWLLSEAASYVTGTSIDVSGGR